MASPTSEVSFSAIGIPAAHSIASVPILGKVRRWSSLAAYEKWLVVLCNVCLLGVLGFTSYAIRIAQTGSDRTYAIVIAFNVGVCFIYIWKGVLQENPSTMVILVIGTVVLCPFVVGNFFAAVTQGSLDFTQPRMAVKLARLVLLLLSGVPIVIMSLKATVSYYQSKNLIFRTVGANLNLQSACQMLHIGQSLLLCDYQLATSLIILGYNDEAMCTRTVTDSLRVILLALGLVFSFAWLLLGYFAMSREKAIGMCVFGALSFLSPAYLVYIVYCVSTSPGFREDTNFINIASLICAACGIVVRVLVIICTIRIYRNFRKGLTTRGSSSDEGQEPIINSS